MRIVTGLDQEAYWETAKYRGADDPVALAYACPKIQHILKYVDLRHACILDVACGTGIYTNLFARFASYVVGIDCSPSMLRRNSAKRLLRGIGEQLPFASDSFDVTFAACLLHHSAEPERIVREMARVSRRYVIVIEPNLLNPAQAGRGRAP